MAYSSGTFTRPVASYTPNATISSADMNSEMDGIATGLSTAITKDGQTTITANLPMSGFAHTGVAVATARTMYARASQIADGSLTYGGVAGGTADALTIAPSPAITGYVIGQQFQFKVGASPNTTAGTLNVNSIGVGSITWPDGTALVAGDLPANAMVVVEVQATTPVFHLVSQTRATPNIVSTTAETAPAVGDSVLIYDLSATANRKMVLSDLLKVINALTEDTGPDSVADFLLTYDTSASAVKKTLLKRAGAMVPLTAIDLTGASAADIVLDTTNHRALVVYLDAVVMTSDGANLLARVSIDGGSTFISTGTYGDPRNVTDTSPANTPGGGGSDTSITIAGAVDSTASQSLSGIVDVLIGGAAANATKLFFRAGYLPTTVTPSHVAGYGSNATTSQVNAIRFLPSTSTFASGFVRPYAILK